MLSIPIAHNLQCNIRYLENAGYEKKQLLKDPNQEAKEEKPY